MKAKWIIVLIGFTIVITSRAQAFQDQSRPEPQQQQREPTPDVDRILENYINALGGKAAIQRVSSRVSKGVIKVPGVTLSGTVEIYEKVPSKQLVIMQMPGLGAMRQGFNGLAGWIEEPLSAGPRELSRGELATISRNADFYQSLRLREHYPRIMFKTKEKVGEREAYVLEAPRGGNPKRWYFDTATGLLIRTTSSEGGELDEELYDDYRSVDGVKLPFSIRRSDLDDAIITLTEVKHNVPIDDARFEKPVPPSAKNAALPGTNTTLAKSGQVIPFELYNNNIYLQVRVNGSEPLTFVLDTGASNSAIDEARARGLGLKLSEMNEANAGSGEGTTRIGTAADITFSLPGAEAFAKHVIIFPMKDLVKLDGKLVDGILGYDFFTRFVVQVDYSGGRLTLYDPQSFKYAGPGEVVPFTLINDRPAVYAKVIALNSRPIEGKFGVDTGMSGTLMLYSPVVKNYNLLTSGQKTMASVAVGVGGELRVLVGRVESFQLGGFSIEHPVAYFSQATSGTSAGDETVGNCGGEILRRFKAIFDYSRQQMVLERNAAFSDPYEADMSGISLIAGGEDLKARYVYRVLPNSPAAEAGISDGDVIIAINGKPAGDSSLAQIGQLFKHEGKEFLLTIKRGEKLLRIKLKLRRLV